MHMYKAEAYVHFHTPMACRAWMTSNHNTHMQTHTADARDRVGTTASGWRMSARVTSWSHMQTDRYAL